MVELVNMQVSETCAERLEGSTPSLGTKFEGQCNICYTEFLKGKHMDFSKLKQMDASNYKVIDPEAIVTMIVEVKQAGYVPDRLQLRAQIGEFMFTAQCKEKELKEIEKDVLVERISRSQILQSY